MVFRDNEGVDEYNGVWMHLERGEKIIYKTWSEKRVKIPINPSRTILKKRIKSKKRYHENEF